MDKGDDHYWCMTSILKHTMERIKELDEKEVRLSDLLLIQEEKKQAEKYHTLICQCMIEHKKYLKFQNLKTL